MERKIVEVNKTMLSEILGEYQLFQQQARALSPGSLRNYVSKVKGYMLYLGGSPVLADMTPQSLKRFLLATSSQQPKTFRTANSALHNFIRWMVSEGYLSADIMPRVPRPKVADPIRQPPPTHIVSDLLNACDRLPRHAFHAAMYRAVLSTLVYGGLRRSEVVALKPADFDVSERCLRIREGKGMQSRSVYLPAEAMQAIKDYIRLRPITTLPNLFIRSEKRPLSGEGIAALINEVKVVAGHRNVHLTPHLLRHFYATHSLIAGIPLPVVQANMGHNDIATTAIYTHVAAEHQKQFAHMTSLQSGVGHPAKEELKAYLTTPQSGRAADNIESTRRSIRTQRR